MPPLSLDSPGIQWYPGHIAKAEQALTAALAQVDLVIEVRDARIPLATGHPRLQRWIAGKQHLLVLNRRDMVPSAAREAWDQWFRGRGQPVWWCDARAGTGVNQLQQAAVRAGAALNGRRRERGMRPRAVRALMLGFPNVGKSALINRLVRQRVVESARRAGVTRSLRWVRLGQDLDLLDAPGVLPPRLDDQRAALRLALCDDIGQAAYDSEAVALAFLRLLETLQPRPAAGVAPGLLAQRYGVPLAVLPSGAPDGEGWLVTVPPSRAMDLQREVDLIEEVARLVGYDRFASHLPDPIAPGGLSPAQQAERQLRRHLVAAGFQETCSLSLGPASTERPGGDPQRRLPLANPLLADYSHLRDSLLDELLLAAQRNLQAGQEGFWAFEIGHVFDAATQGERQHLHLTGVLCGSRQAELWSSGGKPAVLDYFQARGVLQQALAALKLPLEDRRLSDEPLLHPGRAAQIVVEGRPAGWFGQLHPELCERFDLPEASYGFQLTLASVLTAATRSNRWQPAFTPFATVPASERDLAVVVPDSTASSQLLQAIRKAGKPLLEQAVVVDRYTGEQVATGHCSQAFRLRYRDPKRTLTDAEVDAAHQAIRGALERQFGAALRT